MTYPNGGQRDEGHPNRQVGKNRYFSPDRGVPLGAPVPMPSWMVEEYEQKDGKKDD